MAAQGQALLALSKARLQPLVDGIYGAQALLLTPDCSHLPELSPPMAGLRLHVGQDGRLDGDLRASATNLPLPSDSMAFVLLQYALHGDHADALLEECIRVLAPEGIALILGVNRLSAWSLWARRRTGGFPPGSGACRRLLAANEVETLQVRHFGPLLPGSAAESAFTAASGSRWLGPLRASFLLIARKRRAQATPLRLAAMQRGRVASPGLAGSFREAS